MDEKKRKKRGRPASLHQRVLDKSTGEIYSDYRVAAAATGSNRGDVYLCLMHYRKSHNGREFEFVDDSGDINFNDNVTAGFSGVNQSLCNGFAGVNQSLCNGFAGVNAFIANGFSAAEVPDE